MTNHFTDPSAPEPSDAEIEAHITGLDIVSDVPGPFTGRNPRETFNWSSAGAPEVTIEALPPTPSAPLPISSPSPMRGEPDCSRCNATSLTGLDQQPSTF